LNVSTSTGPVTPVADPTPDCQIAQEANPAGIVVDGVLSLPTQSGLVANAVAPPAQ